MMTRYLAVFIAGVVIACWIETLRWDADISAINLAHTQALKTLSDKALADLSLANQRANQANAAIAALDIQHQSELAHVLTENQKLVTDVAAGTRRVLIATADLATCQLRKAAGSSAGSMGNATQVELTRTAGQNILDIRAGIIADQAKLEYLQGYIKSIKGIR